MAMYTFLCTKCEVTTDIIESMKKIQDRRIMCPGCGKKMSQDYSGKKYQYMPDEIVGGLACHTLRSVRDPKNPKAIDTVHSRSELKQLMKQHDKMYGTKLVHSDRLEAKAPQL